MTVTPTAPVLTSQTAEPTRVLARFECSHSAIANGAAHLYHAQSATVAARRFVNDWGSPGRTYEVRVKSDNSLTTNIIPVEKQG